MLTAQNVMTSDVVTVTKETTVRDLAEIFTTRKISSVPVLDKNGNLAGIVTESDLIEQDRNLHIPTVISLFDWVIYLESGKKFEQQLKKMTGQTVGDIYQEEVVTVVPTTPVSEIAELMTRHRIHSIPVVAGSKVVGIVARIDLVRSMASK
jgi:CBS domain-containing protein